MFSKKLRGQLSNELREIVEVLDAGDEEATPAAVRNASAEPVTRQSISARRRDGGWRNWNG